MSVRLRPWFPGNGPVRVLVQLLALLMALALPARAAEALHVAAGSPVLAGPAIEVLEDATGQMTLADVLAPAAQSRFAAPGRAGTNFGYSRSAFWLRFRVHLDAGAPANWLLEVGNPSLEDINVHVFTGAGGHFTRHGGARLPFAERPVVHRHHVQPIELSPNGENLVLIRAASSQAVSVPVRLWQPDALWHHDQFDYGMLTLYFGLLLGLAAYNLLLYASIRDRVCLSYTAFAVAMGMIQASISGLGAQYLWPALPELNILILQSARALVSLLAVQLVRDYLGTALRMPRVDTWLRVLALGWAVVFVVALGWQSRAFNLLGAVFSIASLVLVLGIGLAGLRRGYPEARYFVAAWLAMAAGTATFALHNLGLLPTGPVTANALRLGSAVQMLLLAFALAGRVKSNRMDKERLLAETQNEQARRAAFLAARERYLAVIDHVDAGIVVDACGRTAFANQRAATITARSVADLRANGFLATVHPDDRELFVRWSASVTGPARGGVRQEVRILRPDGTKRWIELGGGVVPWDTEQGVLTFFTDITQRKADAAELQVMLVRQEELAQVRKRFVTMTSHEFRTPLATIQSSAELLANYGDRLGASETSELLQSIATSVRRMTHMLDRILLLSRAEAGMIKSQPEEVDLAQAFAHWLPGIVSEHGGAGRDVRLEIDPRAARAVLDATLLVQLLANLVSNALKFSAPPGPVRVQVQREDNAVVLAVSDQGIGIPAAEQGHLFQPFYRCRNAGEVPGVGLGLAMVRVIVDIMGGDIIIHSDEHGSRFLVRLPQPPDPGRPPVAEAGGL